MRFLVLLVFTLLSVAGNIVGASERHKGCVEILRLRAGRDLIRIEVAVDPHTEHRAIQVAVFDEDGFLVTTSGRQLEGDQHPRVMTFEFKSLRLHREPFMPTTASAVVIVEGGHRSQTMPRTVIVPGD